MSTSYSHITLAQLEAAVREIAAEQPDYIYETNPEWSSDELGGGRCAYVHMQPATDGSGPTLTPGCIFGHALNRLGVPLSVLRKQDTSAVTDTAIKNVLVDFGIATPKNEQAGELEWFIGVQTLQDDQEVGWADCVRIADRDWDAPSAAHDSDSDSEPEPQ